MPRPLVLLFRFGTLGLAALAAAPTSAARVSTGGGDWRWPVEGEVITPYRNGSDPYARGQHRGIDIAAAPGRPVVAAAGGTVSFVGTVGASGLTVSVRTADGRYDTSYLHLSAAVVAAGERVRAGEPLGAVGTSGRPSDPRSHLHFGVREAGRRHAYVDPLSLLGPPPSLRAGDPPPAQAPLPVSPPATSPRPAPTPSPGTVPTEPARALRGAGQVLGRATSGVPVWLEAPLGSAPSPVVRPAPRLSRPAGAASPRAESPPDGARGGAPVPERVASDRAPASTGGGTAGGGTDLGWLLACAALALAAVGLGRSREAHDRNRSPSPGRRLRAREAAR